MTKPTTILILIILSLLCLNPACYAKVRYVNTASVGGDGTTNNLTGATAAYKSLFDWEAAEDGIPLTEPMIVYCEGTAADTTAVTIYGWTDNSATNYIKITTTEANRHNGKWDDTKYRLGDNDINVLEISEEYVRIEGLQVETLLGTSTGRKMIQVYNIEAANDIRISHCILKGHNSDTYYQVGFESTDTDTNLTFWNNIVYNLHPTVSNNSWIAQIYCTTAYLYNNTFVSGYRGVRSLAGTIVAKNNIVQNTGGNDCWFGTFDASSDYNISDVAGDQPASGTHDLMGVEVTFVDEDNDDFRLAASDTGAKDWGTDLSNDANLSFSDDIQGQSRPWGGVGSWDIGADEAVPTSGVKIGAY